MQPLLDKLYDNCYTCSIVQKQPRISVPDESKSKVPHPHRHFHADVIKREGQYILMLTDHFSTMTNALLVDNEQANKLKKRSHLTPLNHETPWTDTSHN